MSSFWPIKKQHLAIKEISLMESRAVGYNFERGPLNEHDHPCKVLFKCECVLQTDDGCQVMAKAHLAFGQVTYKKFKSLPLWTVLCQKW